MTKMNLYIAKFGEEDFRVAISKSNASYIIAHPKQYFNNSKVVFNSLNEAISKSPKLFESQGVVVTSTHFLGDFKEDHKDNDWDNHIGDVIQF